VGSPDGFEAFHSKFCPELGQSRTYELLAIAAGTKTVEQLRAETRERVARHRAEKASSVSVTVTETDSILADSQSSSVTDEINSEPTVPVEAALQRSVGSQAIRDRITEIVNVHSLKLTLENRVNYLRENGTQADLEKLYCNVNAAISEVFEDIGADYFRRLLREEIAAEAKVPRKARRHK
jgi:hypothetical protein